jgi:4-hydroxybenzoate polyprenyltransferase
MPPKPVALALSTHPGPAVAVTIITVGLGFGVGLAPERLVLLGFAMLAGQISMGLSNDWIDADRDRAVGRKDKPISRGWISVGAVRTTAWLAAAASILLSLPLGWLATLALVFAIGLGWAYNAGLKKSAWSIVPYVLSFGSLPAVASFALPEPAAPAPWALGVGGLLGAAAHFANTLPDLETDRATGVSGLPHRLGRRVSSIVTYVALLLASVLELSGTGGFGFVPADIGLAVNIVIASIGIAAARRATRWHFRLIIIAALVDVVVLIFAGARLLA